MSKKSAKSSRPATSLRASKKREVKTKPVYSAGNVESDSVLPGDYRQFVKDLKDRIRSARIAAARTVNRELILLYWDLGQAIKEKLCSTQWGSSVVERISADLRHEFPDVQGFSVDNLWRMRRMFTEYSDSSFLAQLVPELEKQGFEFLAQLVPELKKSGKFLAKPGKARALAQHQTMLNTIRQIASHVPWGHHLEILNKVKSPAPRIYYLVSTIRLGWSRSVLLNQIKAKAFERSVTDKKSNNFAIALPEYFAEQANEMMKSSYNLEFLGIREAVLERDLENRLIESVQDFILELGYGFCFIGRQYRLVLGSKEYFVDLLFYHRFLKALVALDLKIRGFIPEDAGKMDFYLNLLNDKERGPDDQPSIGIILCAEKDDIEVEYALKSKSNPIGVAQYQLQARLPAELKGKLPTARQLAEAVRRGLPRSKTDTTKRT